MHIVKNPRQNHTSGAQFVKNAKESHIVFWGDRRLDLHIVKNPRQNHTSVAQFVKNARESHTFWGGGHRLELSRYIFIDRRVTLDYVKRDAVHFC